MPGLFIAFVVGWVAAEAPAFLLGVSPATKALLGLGGPTLGALAYIAWLWWADAS